MSRRLTVLLVGAVMAALMMAVAGAALAAPGAPTVVRTVPADETGDVSTTANIKAKFSEAMRAASINDNTFVLYPGRLSRAQLNDGCTGCLPASPNATVSYNPDTRTAVLNPETSLQGGTTYTAVVEGADDTDGFAVKDRDGKPLARDYIFHFTTASGCGLC